MTNATLTNSHPIGDAYDRLTLKFENIDTILHTLSDHDRVCEMDKHDAAVFCRMVLEIFDTARNDAKKLYSAALFGRF